MKEVYNLLKLPSNIFLMSLSWVTSFAVSPLPLTIEVSALYCKSNITTSWKGIWKNTAYLFQLRWGQNPAFDILQEELQNCPSSLTKTGRNVLERLRRGINCDFHFHISQAEEANGSMAEQTDCYSKTRLGSQDKCCIWQKKTVPPALEKSCDQTLTLSAAPKDYAQKYCQTGNDGRKQGTDQTSLIPQSCKKLSSSSFLRRNYIYRHQVHQCVLIYIFTPSKY